MKSSRRAEEKKQEAQDAASTGSRRYAGLSILMSLGLPALFLVSLLVPNNTVRWVFLAASGVSVLLMWILRAFVKSARSTLTVIYVALAVVIGLALFINRQTPESRNLSASRASQAASLFSNTDAGSVNALLNELTTEAPDPAEEEEQVSASETKTRLEGFFVAWGKKSASEMLPYCLPSWVSQQTSPQATLFQMLFRSRPAQMEIESISGSDGNASRIATVKVSFEENNTVIVKRLHVIMQKINDIWYVNPESLDGVPVDEAAEAAAQESVAFVGTTIAPTATPAPEGSELIVYYNTNNGKYYHTSPTCSAVASEYWPLTGKIPFSLINSQQYSKLLPCSKCAAPTRPPVSR